MRTVRIALVLGMLALAAALPAARGAFPGTNGTIVFVGPGAQGNTDIYTIRPDGTGRTNLIGDGYVDREPAVSPDGSKIAWMSTRSGRGEIWVMGIDGSNPRQLTDRTPGSDNPSWSPDGNRIAFDYSGNIWVVATDTLALTELTTSGRDSDPAWSPDGGRIAFVSDRAGTTAVWLMSADGGGQHQVTSTHVGGDGEPSWSPDGATIAFLSTRRGGGEIWTLDVATGTETPIVTIDGGNGTNPVFSPDGTKVLFDWGGELLTVDTSGANRQPLSAVGFLQEAQPDWAVAQPPPPPPPTGPCILVSPAGTVDFGTARFSTPGVGNEVTKAGATVEVTSCSDSRENVSVRGTDASGPTATWTLTNQGASPCSVGNDVFSLRLGQLDLTPNDQSWGPLAPGASLSGGTTLTMPCTGSGGLGETLETSIVLTATG